MNPKPAATKPHLHNSNLRRLVIGKIQTPQLYREWLPHNNPSSLWMTHPSSLSTKNCPFPRLFGGEVSQVFRDFISGFIFPFESCCISSSNMELVYCIRSERIPFLLAYFQGIPAFPSPQDSHVGHPHMGDTSHYIAALTIYYLVSRDSVGRGLRRVGFLLASIQMSSAEAGSFSN